MAEDYRHAQAVDAIIDAQGWNATSQALLFRRFIEDQGLTAQLSSYLSQAARDENGEDDDG